MGCFYYFFRKFCQNLVLKETAVREMSLRSGRGSRGTGWPGGPARGLQGQIWKGSCRNSYERQRTGKRL
jgi:hypothetical protein